MESKKVFSSVILKKSIFTKNADDLEIFALNLVWELGIESDMSSLTVIPKKIISAHLHIIKNGETIVNELSGWSFELYKIQERNEPFKFFIYDVDLDFKTKKLIASI